MTPYDLNPFESELRVLYVINSLVSTDVIHLSDRTILFIERA